MTTDDYWRTIAESYREKPQEPCEDGRVKMNKYDILRELNRLKILFCSVHRLAVDSYRQGINDAIRLVELLDEQRTEITLESAVDYLHSIGWLQKHDKALTEGVGVLDKIRAEIVEDIERYNDIYDDTCHGLRMALDIIDKYKTESEGSGEDSN